MHTETGLEEIDQNVSNSHFWAGRLWKTPSCFEIPYNVIWKGMKYCTHEAWTHWPKQEVETGLSCWDWLPCAHILSPQFCSASALPPQPSARGRAHPRHSCSWLLFQICSVHLPLAVGLFSLKGLTLLHTLHITLHSTSQNQGSSSFGVHTCVFPLPSSCMYVYTKHTHTHTQLPNSTASFLIVSFTINYSFHSCCHCTQ